MSQFTRPDWCLLFQNVRLVLSWLESLNPFANQYYMYKIIELVGVVLYFVSGVQ